MKPRLARNAMLNLVGQGAPALIGLMAMPSIAHGLGKERLGLLGLGWVVLGYFSLLDLGMGRAAARFIAEAISHDDHEAIPAIAWSAVVIQCGIGALGGLIMASAARGLATLLHVSPPLRTEAITTFRVLALAIPVVLISASFRGVLEAARRFDLVQSVAVPGSALNFLIPLVGTLTGLSFSGIIWLLVAGRTVTAVAFFLLSTRLFPELGRGLTVTRTVIRRLLSFGAWATVSNVVSPVLDQLDRFMLGAFTSVTSVGYYTAPQEIVLRMRVLPTALSSALFPEFSSLGAQGGADRARHYYALSLRFLCLALLPVAVILVYLGSDILRVWLGEDFARQSGTALGFLGIGLLGNSLAYVPYAFLHGINRPDVPAKFHMLELPCFLVMAAFLMPRYGVAGAGAVWALRAWLDAGLLLAGARRLGAREDQSQKKKSAWLWAALAGVIVSLGLTPAMHARPLSQRLIIAAAAAAVTAIVGWMALLNAEDRQRVRSLLPMAQART